jgi:hypothetical protein
MDLPGAGPQNLPTELTVKVRPARRPDMPLYVAQFVADVCEQTGITEHMIRDISMETMQHGADAQGSFTQVMVRFYYM